MESQGKYLFQRAGSGPPKIEKFTSKFMFRAQIWTDSRRAFYYQARIVSFFKEGVPFWLQNSTHTEHHAERKT